MNKKNLSILFMSLLILTSCAFAENRTITITNVNVNKNYIPSSGYGGNILCTDGGGICVNSGWALLTSRTYYAPSRWRQQTLREKRLARTTNTNDYQY